MGFQICLVFCLLLICQIHSAPHEVNNNSDEFEVIMNVPSTSPSTSSAESITPRTINSRRQNRIDKRAELLANRIITQQINNNNNNINNTNNGNDVDRFFVTRPRNIVDSIFQIPIQTLSAVSNLVQTIITGTTVRPVILVPQQQVDDIVPISRPPFYSLPQTQLGPLAKMMMNQLVSASNSDNLN